MVRAPITRRVHVLTTILVMVTLGVLVAQAQPQPLLQPVFPLPGQDAVDVTSSVVVRAPAAVDPTTVATFYPNTAPNGWRPLAPTLLVIREDVAQSTSRDLWYRHAVHGTTAIENDRTLRWKPARLLPRTTYRCVVSGVALAPHHGGTLCPPLEYTFTTVRPVPSVRATTLDTLHVITCKQIVQISWKDPLPSPALAHSLVSVDEHASDGTWQPVQIAVVPSPDGMSASVVPLSGWSSGRPIRLRCRLDEITGDPLTSYVRQAIVRGAVTIRTRVTSADGQPVPSDVVEAFDTTTVVVPTGRDHAVRAPLDLPAPWQFVRWQTTQVDAISDPFDHELRLRVLCETATPSCDVTAVVQRIDSVDITVDIDVSGRVDAYDRYGELIASITEPSTIRVATASAPITLSAIAAANKSFAGWNNAPAGIAGSTAASQTMQSPILIGSGGTPQNINLPSGPRCDPRFIDLDPFRSERYRLVANIADEDADPMFRVEDAVKFTTAREFEDVVTGTRTICVAAERCWQITGYHDPSAGPPVRFATPVQDYCLTAHLLDPENSVTFFARRVPIDLRVERIVLSTEDPNSILTNRQPHPETRIDVAKRVVYQGVEQWMPLGKLTCSTPHEIYERYSLRCGDQVRFTVRAATHRGDEWRWWSVRNNYAMPVAAQQNAAGGVFTLVVDKDIAPFNGAACDGSATGNREVRVQGAFRRLFAVASISMRIRTLQGFDRVKSRFEERWLDPLTYYERQSDEPRGGRQLEYVPRKGTIIKVKYTLPFDAPSILAGGMTASSWDNYLITNPSAQGLDFTTSTGDRGNTNFLPTTGQSPDIVEFFICDPQTRPVMQALHFGIVDVTCGASIRSIYQEPLTAPFTFTAQQMEIPGFGLRLQRADIEYDGDWDFWPFVMKGEIYNSIYGGNLAIDGAHHTSTAFSRLPVCAEQQGKTGECTIAYNDKDRTLGYGDRAMWLQTMWMDGFDKAWWMMTTWDEDCKDEDDCLVNRMDDVVEVVKRGVDAYAGTGSSGDLDWDGSIPGLIKAGTDLIAVLLPPDEQDEFLGEGTFLEDIGSYWGMRTAQAPRIIVDHENIRYHLRGQWYVSKAVLR